LLATTSAASATEWPRWRGPSSDGVSSDKKLIESWALDGDNQLWHDDFVGRSTPLVFDGRVCANGRIGEGADRQALVTCWDARDGRKRWQRQLNVYHTTVPWNRVGWASLAADPETGYVYHQNVDGQLTAFDEHGNTVWRHAMYERFGRFSGYGGRTSTPYVFEDLLLVNVTNTSWGAQGPPRHRYFAFDKRTGEVVWIASPAGPDRDKNTHSNIVVAEIGGRDVMVCGNADGAIYALEPRTGRTIWKFQLSKRGINASVVVGDDVVYASHSEENVDEGTMGRLVAIDATGSGDVTATHELWRIDELTAGHSAPALHDGTLYVTDNSANVHAIDAKTGARRWLQNYGTVGRGSPVVADGKLYVTEVNGGFRIFRLQADGAELLDETQLSGKDGRYAEIYGSPAIAYRRIYFTSEKGVYCLGHPTGDFARPGTARRHSTPPPGTGAAVTALVIPGDVLLEPGDEAEFFVRKFDDRGEPLARTSNAATWTLEGIDGTIENGTLQLAASDTFQVGHVVAKWGKLEAKARIRVMPAPPWTLDFDDLEDGARVPYWIGASRYPAKKLDGNGMIEKFPVPRGLQRSNTLIGSPRWRDYTIQTDLMGTKKGRRMADLGLVNGGYTLDLMGAHQRLQVRAWASTLRIAEHVAFAWEPDVWYTMKMQVEPRPNKTTVRGKVWKRGQAEPKDWTITVEDHLAIQGGAPGLYGYSPVSAFYDNVTVTPNQATLGSPQGGRAK